MECVHVYVTQIHQHLSHGLGRSETRPDSRQNRYNRGSKPILVFRTFLGTKEVIGRASHEFGDASSNTAAETPKRVTSQPHHHANPSQQLHHHALNDPTTQLRRHHSKLSYKQHGCSVTHHPNRGTKSYIQPGLYSNKESVKNFTDPKRASFATLSHKRTKTSNPPTPSNLQRIQLNSISYK